MVNANIIPPVRGERVHRLPVDEAELVKLFPMIKPYSHIFYTDPATVKDFKDEWLVSKLWRVNNLYKVQTKATDEDSLVVDFIMKREQLIVYAMLLRHPRIVVLKSRQIGISTVTMILYGDDMLVTPHLKVGIVGQNQEAANGLKDKISFAIETMPTEVREFLGVRITTDNDKEVGLSNGSTAVARLSFRSGTLHRFAWTEVGKIAANDPARITETLSGSMQAIAPVKNNFIVKESTAEGDNYFKTAFYNAVESVNKPITMKDDRPLFFSWLTDATCNSDASVEIPPNVEKIVGQIEEEYTKYIHTRLYRNQLGNFIYPDGYKYKLSESQKAWMVGAIKELGYDLELFFREYPHTPESAFYSSNAGVWYRKAMQTMREDGRLVHTDPSSVYSSLYNPDYEVIAVTDIGYSDRFFIIYAQLLPTGIITKEGLEVWDIRVLGEDYDTDAKTDYYGQLIHKQPYSIKTVVLPHDGSRSTVMKDSVSIEDDFYSMGFNPIVLPRPTKLLPYILRTRSRLYNTRIDESRAPELVRNLENYKKKYDKVLKQYTSDPVHDIHSHGADCFRYLASLDIGSAKVVKHETSTPYDPSFNSMSSLGRISI